MKTGITWSDFTKKVKQTTEFLKTDSIPIVIVVGDNEIRFDDVNIFFEVCNVNMEMMVDLKGIHNIIARKV